MNKRTGSSKSERPKTRFGQYEFEDQGMFHSLYLYGQAALTFEDPFATAWFIVFMSMLIFIVFVTLFVLRMTWVVYKNVDLKDAWEAANARPVRDHHAKRVWERKYGPGTYPAQ